ncbi:choice-of-anchor A family protein [Streptomyces sp. DSM 44915]|uniref:Choice-of-anchor A family protein n=1 Tax=Streptomyces chisholmiae TaxID=3075540 RepID=A0ABU2JUM2_9ACTN|nr:collagen-binding domain-containing protein [Streptomyces sp. DSM 44915]MDT0268679.1 choice-of-anchor A family protein [Streptomyces sp. DSM 44915]
MMMHRQAIARAMFGVVLGATLPLAFASPASAQGFQGNPLEGNEGFGVIVEEDAQLGSTESEGPVAVGGDLSFGAGYNVALNTPGTFVAPGDTNPTALLVGGQVDFAASDPNGVLRVLNDGYVKIGDLTGADVLNEDNNGASVNTQVVEEGAPYNSVPRIELTTQQPLASVGPQPGLIDFADVFATYRERAQQIAECPANVTLDDGNLTLLEGQTNVLHLTGEELNDLGEITFQNQPSASTPLVIVVDTTATGGVFEWDVPNLAGIGGAQAPYILWDFPDATDITIVSGDTLEGTIFAPSALLTDLDASNIEGDIVVRSLVAGPIEDSVNAGEIHYFPFDAEIECGDVEPDEGEIRVEKTDAESGEPLSGAVFELWRETNGLEGLQVEGADPDTMADAPCVTDSDGSCVFDGLAPGEYYLRETAVPGGYQFPEQTVTGPYTLTEDNLADGITVELENEERDRGGNGDGDGDGDGDGNGNGNGDGDGGGHGGGDGDGDGDGHGDGHGDKGKHKHKGKHKGHCECKHIDNSVDNSVHVNY